MTRCKTQLEPVSQARTRERGAVSSATTVHIGRTNRRIAYSSKLAGQERKYECVTEGAWQRFITSQRESGSGKIVAGGLAARVGCRRESERTRERAGGCWRIAVGCRPDPEAAKTAPAIQPASQPSSCSCRAAQTDGRGCFAHVLALFARTAAARICDGARNVSSGIARCRPRDSSRFPSSSSAGSAIARVYVCVCVSVR